MSGVTLGEINVVCTDLEAALGFYRDGNVIEIIGSSGDQPR